MSRGFIRQAGSQMISTSKQTTYVVTYIVDHRKRELEVCLKHPHQHKTELARQAVLAWYPQAVITNVEAKPSIHQGE